MTNTSWDETEIDAMAHPQNPPREPFKVAAVEFDAQFLTLDRNLPRLAAVVEEAARAGAKLILLPENPAAIIQLPQFEAVSESIRTLSKYSAPRLQSTPRS